MEERNEANIRLGNNLRRWRKIRDLTLKEMAEKVNLSWGTYQKYETGQIKHVDTDKVNTFAKALDVSPQDLLEWNDEQPYINNPGPNPFIGMTSKQFPGKMQQTANEIPLSPEARDFIETYQNAPEEVKQAIRALLKYSK